MAAGQAVDGGEGGFGTYWVDETLQSAGIDVLSLLLPHHTGELVKSSKGPPAGRRYQNTAIGLTGEPVAPGTCSGATIIWNSHRPSSSQTAASCSSSALSTIGMPM